MFVFSMRFMCVCVYERAREREREAQRVVRVCKWIKIESSAGWKKKISLARTIVGLSHLRAKERDIDGYVRSVIRLKQFHLADFLLCQLAVILTSSTDSFFLLSVNRYTFFGYWNGFRWLLHGLKVHLGLFWWPPACIFTWVSGE